MSIRCFFGFHDYRLSQKLTDYSRRVHCARCRRMYAMNDDVQALVDWGADFHRMYESHGIKIHYLESEGSKPELIA